ncbi:MAG: response regulator [Chloroflexi bacterium]|nr:response regulator [Chloroflexota bacterium]
MIVAPVKSGAGQRVLLVEDDPAISDLMQTVLRELGLTVEAANTGAKALEMARHEPPALAILDLGLPEMYGKTVAQRLKSEQPDLPVLVVSALSSSTVAQDAWEMGAYSYVTKPFELDAFTAAVKRGLSRAKRRATA